MYQFTTEPTTFINGVIVTRDAAYFTDSFRPVFYRLPLGPGGGLPDPTAVAEIPLSGDYVFVPGQFNANGIEATPDGKTLIIVNTVTGTLYRVDPWSGEATEIDLGGSAVPNGDGILLSGYTLYVVQNFLNQVSVVQLAPNLASGEIVQVITHPMFDIPTTAAKFGSRIYVVNARFTTPPTPTTDYWVVQLP